MIPNLLVPTQRLGAPCRERTAGLMLRQNGFN
jgi:hypothetical protein